MDGSVKYLHEDLNLSSTVGRQGLVTCDCKVLLALGRQRHLWALMASQPS